MFRHMWKLYQSAPKKAWFLRAQVSLARASLPSWDRRARTVVSADGTALSARCSGQGDPIVLVHGGIGGKDVAFPFIEAALRDDFAVWTYDRRGFGGSGDGHDYSLEKETEDLLAVIESTGSSPHVVAHSYGATCALRAATRGADMRSLVLYEPPLRRAIHDEAAERAFEEIERLEAAIERGDLDWALRRFYEIVDVTRAEISILSSIRPLWRRLLDGVPHLPREIAAIRSWEWEPDPSSLPDIPVLLVAGEKTRAPLYPTTEALREGFHNAEIAIIPGQRHMATGFAPWRFVDEVSRFITAR